MNPVQTIDKLIYKLNTLRINKFLIYDAIRYDVTDIRRVLSERTILYDSVTSLFYISIQLPYTDVFELKTYDTVTIESGIIKNLLTIFRNSKQKISCYLLNILLVDTSYTVKNELFDDIKHSCLCVTDELKRYTGMSYYNDVNIYVNNMLEKSKQYKLLYSKNITYCALIICSHACYTTPTGMDYEALQTILNNLDVIDTHINKLDIIYCLHKYGKNELLLKYISKI